MQDDRVVTAAVLRNRMESDLLGSVLSERNIPFVVVVHDHFLGEGIFKLREGWGHVEAPESFQHQIEEIYRDLFPAEGISGESGEP